MVQGISLKSERKTHDLNHDLTFSAHIINCVCHSIRSMFRVLGVYNFCLLLFVYFLFFITNTLTDPILLGHIWAFGIFYKNLSFTHKLHDNSVWPRKYSKQGTKSMRKIWGKENGGSFGLGRKSLGSDTKTWSWFRLPIPKPGIGRTLV